jgi:hypothetical protein
MNDPADTGEARQVESIRSPRPRWFDPARLRALSDEHLCELMDGAELRQKLRGAVALKATGALYAEMIRRHRGLGKAAKFRWQFPEMRTVAKFARLRGLGVLRPVADAAPRELLLPRTPNPLAGRLILPDFIGPGAFRAPERSEVSLCLAKPGKVVFRPSSYALIVGDGSLTTESMFIPTKREVRRTRFAAFGRCLFGGVFRGADNISHFTFDAFPRILLALRDRSVDAVVLSPPDSLTPYQRHLCELKGVPVVQLEPGQGLQAEELLYFAGVSLIAQDGGGSMSHPANYCHPELLAPLTAPVRPPPAPGAGKLYVSRLDSKRRPMVNEAELAAALAARGYFVMTPTEWSPADQIAFFQNADVIVGPHGAGLTGLFATRPTTRVLEIFPPCGCADYAAISIARGLDYRFIVGEPVSGHQRFAYRVEPEAVLQAMG